MNALNNKMILSVLSVALLATPAFAQRPHRQSSQQQTTQFQNDPSDDAIVNGRYVGVDPNPNFRTELNNDSDDWGPSANGN
jgi:hypothetical protein